MIAMDLPAFGLSESRAGVRSPEGLGEFVMRIVDSFGLDRPHVVAPDVGTPACQFRHSESSGSLQEISLGLAAIMRRKGRGWMRH